MKAKITVTFLIITILINTIFPSFLNASSFSIPSMDETSKHFHENNPMDGLEEGTVSVPTGQSTTPFKVVEVTHTPTQGGAAAKIIVGILMLFPITFNSIVSIVNYTASGGTAGLDFLTVEEIVMGEVPLLDIDYFNYRYATTSGGTTLNNANSIIKSSVASWYYSIRNLAIAILLLVLIYIGIRMAMSTVASEKATYKKMFTSWMTSFILVFIMHYIIIIALFISKSTLTLLSTAAQNSLNGTWTIFGGIFPIVSFERKIYLDAMTGMLLPGWNCVGPFLAYLVLSYYLLRFFIMYLKRLIATGFLILIAPLVTITYSIDKIGDDKAQAFEAWFGEIMVNIFIQPVHALLYLVFMYTAGAIAMQAPILAAIFFMALSR